MRADLISAPQNARQRHTGQLSVVTYALNTLGGLGRIFTSMQELNDPIVVAAAVCAFFQNLVLTVQV